MSDIQRDSRVVSLSSRAGIRNSLVTILDQLQRCQKSLNEFLEVHKHIRFSVQILHLYSNVRTCCYWLCLFGFFAGKALCLPTFLFYRRWWSFRDSRTSDQPKRHPITPQKTLCRFGSLFFFILILCFVLLKFSSVVLFFLHSAVLFNPLKNRK